MNTIQTAVDFQNAVFAALKIRAITPNSKTQYSESNPNEEFSVSYNNVTSPFYFRASTAEMLLNIGINPDEFIKNSIANPAQTQKCTKRLIQFLNGIADNDALKIDSTTLMILTTGVRFEGKCPNRELAVWAGAGVGDENTGDLARGISFRKLQDAIKQTNGGKLPKASTIETQYSRTIGKNGFLKALGVARETQAGKTGEILISWDNPLTLKFLQVAEKTIARVFG